MVLAIVLTMFGLIGIIYGIANKRKSLVIPSVIVLIIIVAAMVYFYKNPY